MQDRELYEKLLGLKEPWFVEKVSLDLSAATVTVIIGHPKGASFLCPVCGKPSPVYDHQKRRWRHLDTCGFTTILEAEVPRISCSEHGVKQVTIPWGEPGSRFTALFEAVAISLLKVASLSDVARHLRISWDAASGIMERAVRRGMARRETQPLTRIGIDETSFQKRHEYVTVVFDQERNCVVDVLDGRKKETLKSWFLAHMHALRTLESVSMDMWDAYIGAVRESIPDGVQKICFDRFHVAQYFNKALDKVRADEHRAFKQQGKTSPLTRTKHDWLRSYPLGATNAKNESVNATIQKLKARACGFRNRLRFKMVILFHLGGLSMMPEMVI